MVDEFLYKYEISGKKMVPKVDGDTGIDNFDTIRRAMGQDDRVRYENDSGTSEEGALLPLEYEDKDRWDCETVLSKLSLDELRKCASSDILLKPHTPTSKIIRVSFALEIRSFYQKFD